MTESFKLNHLLYYHRGTEKYLCKVIQVNHLIGGSVRYLVISVKDDAPNFWTFSKNYTRYEEGLLANPDIPFYFGMKAGWLSPLDLYPVEKEDLEINKEELLWQLENEVK